MIRNIFANKRLLPLWSVLLLLLLVPYGLFTRDVWTDEAFTASYTAHPTLGMVLDDVRKNEETPPLYFIFMWVWARIAGRSEVALRIPSLMFAVVSVAFLTYAMQRWRSSAEALFGGILLATSPLLHFYIPEVRVYTLMVLLSIASTFVFEYVWRHPDYAWAYVGYALTTGVLFLSSYFGIVLIAAHNVLWGIRLVQRSPGWSRHFTSWIASQIIIGIMILPWLPSLLYQIHVASSVTYNPPISSDIIFLMLLVFLVGIPYSSLPLILLWIGLMGLFGGLMVYSLLRSTEHDHGMVLRIFGMPMVMCVILLMVLQVSTPRYLMIVMPGTAFGIAAGWHALSQRFPPIGRVLLIALISGMLFCRVTNLMFQHKPVHAWPILANYVKQHADPSQDIIVCHPPWVQRTLEYYYDQPDMLILGAHHYDDFYFVEGHDFRTSWTADEVTQHIHHRRYIWLFQRPSLYSMPPLHLPYRQVGAWSYGDVELLQYEGEVKDE